MSAYTLKILHLKKIIEKSSWACYSLHLTACYILTVQNFEPSTLSLDTYFMRSDYLSCCGGRSKKLVNHLIYYLLFSKILPRAETLRSVLLVSGFWVTSYPAPTPAHVFVLLLLNWRYQWCYLRLLDVLAVTPVQVDKGCAKQPLILTDLLWHFLKTLSRNRALETLFLFPTAFGHSTALANPMRKHEAG